MADHVIYIGSHASDAAANTWLSDRGYTAGLNHEFWDSVLTVFKRWNGASWEAVSGESYWGKSGTVLSPVTSTDTLKVGDGAVSAPSYALASEANSGMYRHSSNTLGWAIGGINRLYLNTGSLVKQGNDAAQNLITHYAYDHGDSCIIGSLQFSGFDDASNPTVYGQIQGYCIENDHTNTLEEGAIIFITRNASVNTERLRVNEGVIVGNGVNDPGHGILASQNEILAGDGLVGNPSFSFRSNTNTGIYRSGANQIGFSLGGIGKWFMYSTSFQSSSSRAAVILEAGGTPGAPTYTFNGDTDTGMYSQNADQIEFSCGATRRFRVTSAAAFFERSGSLQETSLYRTDKLTAAADIGGFSFWAKNDYGASGEDVLYGRIFARATNPADGVENGRITLETIVAGALNERVTIGSGVMVGENSTVTDPGVGSLAIENIVAIGSGTAAAPSMVFRAATTTGIYYGGTNTVSVSTAGVQRTSVDINGLTFNTLGTTNGDISFVVRGSDPSNPDEGEVWYDGTDDMVKVHDDVGIVPLHAFPGSQAAHTIWVCETASTYEANGSANAPYATVTAAITAAGALSPSSSNIVDIVILPGVYDETITTADSYVNFIGLDKAATIISNVTASTSTTVTIADPDTNITFKNLTIRQNDTASSNARVVDVVTTATGTLRFENCRFELLADISTSYFRCAANNATYYFNNCDLVHSYTTKNAAYLAGTSAKFYIDNSNFVGGITFATGTYIFNGGRLYSTATTGSAYITNDAGDITFNGVTIENSTLDRIYSIAASATLKCLGCKFVGSTAPDINANTACSNVTVSGCYMPVGMDAYILVQGNEHIVGGYYDRYQSIDDAITAAELKVPSATEIITIRLKPGIYSEALALNQAGTTASSSYIDIVGEDPLSTIITASGANATMDISSGVSHNHFKNITFRSGGTGYCFTASGNGTSYIRCDNCRFEATADNSTNYCRCSAHDMQFYFQDCEFVHSHTDQPILVCTGNSMKVHLSGCRLVGSSFIQGGTTAPEFEAKSCHFTSTYSLGTIYVNTGTATDVYFKACTIENQSYNRVYYTIDPGDSSFLGCQFIGSNDPEINANTAITNVTVKGCEMSVGIDSYVKTTDVNKYVGGDFDFYEDLAAATANAADKDVIHLLKDVTLSATLTTTSSVTYTIEGYDNTITYSSSEIVDLSASEGVIFKNLTLAGNLTVNGDAAHLELRDCSMSGQIYVESGNNSTHIYLYGSVIIATAAVGIPLLIADDDPYITIYDCYLKGAGVNGASAAIRFTGTTDTNLYIERSTLVSSTITSDPFSVSATQNPSYYGKHNSLPAASSAFTNSVATPSDAYDAAGDHDFHRWETS